MSNFVKHICQQQNENFQLSVHLHVEKNHLTKGSMHGIIHVKSVIHGWISFHYLNAWEVFKDWMCDPNNKPNSKKQCLLYQIQSYQSSILNFGTSWEA